MRALCSTYVLDHELRIGVRFFYRYVQHRIKEHSDLLNDLLKDQHGYFLVSGSMKMMPQQVKEALQLVLGENYVDEMIQAGRYQEETW